MARAALAFLGGTLLAHSAAPEPQTAPPTPVTSPQDTEHSDEQPLPDAERASVTEALPEPAGALVSAGEVVTAPALVPAPAPPIPAVLVDHARKVADEYRARTGAPIDPDTLRSRLGVPPHLADAIAAHLN